MGQCREWGWIVSLDQVAQFQPCDSLLADREGMWFYTLLHGDSLGGSIGEGKGCIDPPVVVWKVCSGVENDLVEINRASEFQGQFCVILHVDAAGLIWPCSVRSVSKFTVDRIACGEYGLTSGLNVCVCVRIAAVVTMLVHHILC